ncbi:retrovirus-related pol polyprotein from transposon TNT 1-94 [Tanacetum coccineum]|uniref:Retrovirus-related pol polyprotein from transposon TNT 1-94 n=1 Tax=Tanacetum coccineum TaxID=301880 RepID=A0ABQ5G3J8_9ASTR
MSWYLRCSWCGGPFNGGNCRHCTNVSFGDEFVCNPDPISNDETPDFSYPPSQPQTSSFDQFHCFECKDPLEDGVRCQRCTCKWCGHGLREGFFPDIPQSHISNQASTSSHPVPQDRWSKDQHIKLVNIIGDPGEGMLTRNMVAKLTAASASECLFTDFLSEIEPKKEAIRIFLTFATYMNFIVFQMDVKSAFMNGKLKEEVYVKQPPGFESSEFPNYVCKLDKALYGLKQAPKACMMGELTYFLGLQIKQDDKGISICQEQYTRNLLKKYEISDYSSVNTPIV